MSDCVGIQPVEAVPCPCEGCINDCELCHGTGTVATGPTQVKGPMKTLVLEARYNAGLPLWNKDDAPNPDWTNHKFRGIESLVRLGIWRETIQHGPVFHTAMFNGQRFGKIGTVQEVEDYDDEDDWE